MWDVSVCAACLATGVRMHSMSDSSLLQPYQLLTGVQIKDVDGISDKLCWECAALVNKFILFRHKCGRAYQLLQDIYNQHDEINEIYIRTIDRECHSLCSSYVISHNVQTINSYEQSEDAFVKIEPESIKDEDLKSECEIESAPLVCSSDDNDARMRDKSRKKRLGKRKREKYSNSETKELSVTKVVVTPEQARQIYVDRRKSRKYAESKYKCALCFQAFREQTAYAKHMRRHDPMSGAHGCDICKRRFSTEEALRLHSGKHMYKFHCDICSKVSFTKDIAKQHFELHKKLGAVAKVRPTKTKKARVKMTADDFGATEIVLTQEQQMAAVRERRNARGYDTARFKCTLCYKAFNEEKTYSNHMTLHDTVSGGLECDICKLRYDTRLKIFKHITNNHARKYACKLCAHTCYNRSFALNHYRWHAGIIYKCDICGAKFDKKTSHRSHLRIKHPSGHVCGACGEPFVSRSGLRQHTDRMHPLKRDAGVSGGESGSGGGPRCAECDIQFTSQQAWTRHILISPKHQHERDSITNGCQYCGGCFETAAELKKHYVTEHRRHKRTFKISPHKKFPAQCFQCEEIMPSAGKYWQHFRQHHPGKPFPLTGSSFICEFCGNWFKYQSALDAHARTHSERHRCAVCPKRFVKLVSLAAHAESHADRGQYSCDVCCRQFAYKRSLTNHFRTHTVEKPHVCEWCGKTFAYECNLKKHELTVHCAAPAAPSSSHPV